MASKYNPFSRLQKWMDTFAGQTFMQYAYSWGAAVVILGTLFKLTHIAGANLMLFIGMGTEVFVFFIAAFERVTEKVPDNEAQNTQQGGPVYVGGVLPQGYQGQQYQGQEYQGQPVQTIPVQQDEPITEDEGLDFGYNEEKEEEPDAPIFTSDEGGSSESSGASLSSGSSVSSASSGSSFSSGSSGSSGSSVSSNPSNPISPLAPIQPAAPVQPAVAPAAPAAPAADVDPEALARSASLSAAAANLAAAGQAAASAQLALAQLTGTAPVQPELPTVDPELVEAVKATKPAEVEEAVKNYTQELTELTEVLSRVKEQTARMTTDSEEMENLNRTITGIATVYELQLKTISKQVSTIEQIDEQTKRMAGQIQELNNLYARMISAMTVNVGGAPVSRLGD